MSARPATSARGEHLAWAALVVVALVLRLLDLDARPFHHDESQDAYFSWLHRFEYDPLLHGPLRFYLTAAMYAVFGATDFTARLAPALMGTALVGLPYLLRGQLGRVGAFGTAALLAFTPSFLYFSRFAREDIYVACITMGMFVVVLRFFDAPRRAHPAIALGLLAASFATKETTFITVFCAGTFLGPLALWQLRRYGRAAPLVRAVASLGGRAWLWGAASFVAVFALLFTIFGTYPAGLWSGVSDGLEYWLAQQPVARGGEPPGFYAFLLWGMEWHVLLLAGFGLWAVVRAPDTGRGLIVWMFLCSLAVYSWASEKFAWLVLHPLLPLVLLAGLGIQALWAARATTVGRVGIALAAAGALHLGYASFAVNARFPADPRELLVSTQSSRDVLGVRDRVLDIADRRTDPPIEVQVDSFDGATFPWAWYFRDLRVRYTDMTAPGVVPEAEVLILTDAAQRRMLPLLGAYDGRRFRLRVWWVKDFGKAASPAEWVRYWATREPWNPTGGLPEWIYVRRDVSG